jgi:hypothetical protein
MTQVEMQELSRKAAKDVDERTPSKDDLDESKDGTLALWSWVTAGLFVSSHSHPNETLTAFILQIIFSSSSSHSVPPRTSFLFRNVFHAKCSHPTGAFPFRSLWNMAGGHNFGAGVQRKYSFSQVTQSCWTVDVMTRPIRFLHRPLFRLPSGNGRPIHC